MYFKISCISDFIIGWYWRVNKEYVLVLRQWLLIYVIIWLLFLGVIMIWVNAHV
jgi:hypothetical protein